MSKYEVVNTHGDYTVEVDSQVLSFHNNKEDAVAAKKRYEEGDKRRTNYFAAGKRY